MVYDAHVIRIRRTHRSQSVNDSWRAPANIVAALAFCVALGAFGVSVRGCSIAEQTLTLQRRDFEAARRIVMQANWDYRLKTLRFGATDPSITIQEINIEYPWTVARADQVLTQPFELSTDPLKQDIGEQLTKVIFSESASSTCFGKAVLPLALRVEYTYKGESITDTALYSLLFTAFYVKGTLSGVDFMQLRFQERLNPEDPPVLLLNESWNSTKTHFVCDES
jgi:hypothetical protein